MPQMSPEPVSVGASVVTMSNDISKRTSSSQPVRPLLHLHLLQHRLLLQPHRPPPRFLPRPPHLRPSQLPLPQSRLVLATPRSR